MKPASIICTFSPSARDAVPRLLLTPEDDTQHKGHYGSFVMAPGELFPVTYEHDFHGPSDWDNFAREMKRLFPDRPIVEIPKDHPVFSCFYKLDGFPQVAGLGSFLAGRSREKGGFIAHLRAILDDNGRPMMFINWNTDMGDGWEWSNAEEYPGYIKYTSLAYRMGINEIVYALTH